MPDLPCSERIQLSEAVSAAAQILDSARAARDLAEKEKREVGPYDAVIASMRKAERYAVSALDKHRKEHGC